MNKQHPQRTSLMNRSFHKYCDLLANELNQAGFDQRKLYNSLHDSIGVDWTYASIIPIITKIGDALGYSNKYESYSIGILFDIILTIAEKIGANFSPKIWETDEFTRSINDFIKNLNESGFSKKVTLNRIPGNNFKNDMISIKELFKAVLPALCGKSSTAELTTIEMMDAYKNFDRAISEATGVHVEWPSDKSLSEQQREF